MCGVCAQWCCEHAIRVRVVACPALRDIRARAFGILDVDPCEEARLVAPAVDVAIDMVFDVAIPSVRALVSRHWSLHSTHPVQPVPVPPCRCGREVDGSSFEQMVVGYTIFCDATLVLISIDPWFSLPAHLILLTY